MVKPAPRRVNPARPQNPLPLLAEQAVIWGTLGGLALIVHLTGSDAALAKAIHQPESLLAWLLRQYGTWPAALLGLVALAALFWPRLNEKKPLAYQTAAVVVITTVIGAGLINQVIVQDLADRPRPKQVVLLPQGHPLPAEIEGKSMPSGHAAMGFALAAPFFVLRRRHPRAAQAFLSAGLAAGAIVGLGRMGLGAHFLSDVLVAGALTLSTASAAAWALRNNPRLPRKYLAAAAILAILAVMLGNQFTMTLSRQLPNPFRKIDLPCPVNAVYHPTAAVPTLEVRLKGYGAPLSTLQLVEKNDVVSLQTSRGLYHGLSCSARLNLPVGPYE